MTACRPIMSTGTPHPQNFIKAYVEIFEQFADNASYLWLLRSIAVEQPHYAREDIQELEHRIDAQLDGLMISIEQSWPICLDALELQESGNTFTAAILAFRSHDVKNIQTVIEVGLANAETEKGLISALGWLPEKLIQSWIEKLLGSKDLNHKYLALAACSVRRQNPGEALARILDRDDCRQHEKLYSRALRLIGEVRRQDLMPYLNSAMNSRQPDIRFWSHWSGVLLGNRNAVENLKPYVFTENPHQQKAINIAFRVLTIDQSRQWIAELGKDGNQSRAVVKATGVLGDPHAVNWLISKMEFPADSRLAAESFTNITGIVLEQYDLINSHTEFLPDHPNDDPDDDDVSLDEDENLPWPAVEKIKNIWINHGRNFIAGQRYFMGRSIEPKLLRDKLKTANQRQRHAAALELAFFDLNVPLPNTRAKVTIDG